MNRKDLAARAEHTLAACAEAIERLGSAESWRVVAPEVLGLLGGATESDRVYIFENSVPGLPAKANARSGSSAPTALHSTCRRA